MSLGPLRERGRGNIREGESSAEGPNRKYVEKLEGEDSTGKKKTCER